MKLNTMALQRYLPKLALIVMLGVAILSCSSPQQTADTWYFQSVARTSQSMNDGWRFTTRATDDAMTSIAVDTGDWAAVELPHSWNQQDGQDGGGNYFQGNGYYRKWLSLGELDSGKRYYLDFAGVSLSSSLYINGRKVGEHHGGFSRFRFDITDYLQAHSKNLIAVKANNEFSELRAPKTNADFTWFGGIYRDVALLEVGTVSIDLEDEGSSGVYLTQKNISNKQAVVNVKAGVNNKSANAFAGQLLITVVDDKGEIVSQQQRPLQVAAHQRRAISSELSIGNPRLWHAKKDPYLYKVYVQLQQAGEVLDEVAQPLGLRQFDIDPDRGFILNGEEYPLRGVAMHQDWGGYGWAIGDAQRARDLQIIDQLGATTIRLAHYPHGDYTYQLADELGIVLWTEIPLINALANTPAFVGNIRQQLRELIKQQYNHPSIAVWGLANEILIQSTQGGTLTEADVAAVLDELANLARELDEDGSRKVALASSETAKLTSPVHGVVDVGSYNRYDGWYHGSFDGFGEYMDEFHQLYPALPVGVSEYGAGAGLSIHSDNPVAGDHSEEFQASLHESYLRQINARPYLWASHVWVMFDFNSDFRNEGEAKGRNDKGLVSADRSQKKDAFYVYQAAWNPSPMVHITGKRKSSTALDSIKVYSNLDTLHLEVNGQPVSSKAQAGEVVFEWGADEVQLNKEESNSIRVWGERDGVVVSDVATVKRALSRSNQLSSAFLGVSVDKAGVGAIANPPLNASLGELKKLLAIPAGARLSVKGQPSGDAYRLKTDDLLLVTAEAGDVREYRQHWGNLALYRPISHNMMSGGGIDALVDGTEQAWVSPGNNLMDPKGYVDIDLQEVYYVDSVEILNDMVNRGSMDFDLVGSKISIDLTRFQSIKGFSEARAVFPVGAETKVLRLQFEASQKQRTNPLAGTYFIVGLEDVRVYGGLIKPAGLTVNYQQHQLLYDGAVTIESVLRGVSPLAGVKLTVVDTATGLAIGDHTTLATERMALVASLNRDGGELREVYRLQRAR